MPKIASKERLKKWLSSLLIFVIFASQTVQFPFTIPRTLAAGSDAPNLVSIIISESANSGDVKGRVKRYANDIQAALTNTRVVIVEVPDNAAPHSIAALNEKLYYHGDGNGISRLVGTVLVGKLPIPVVHKSGKTFLSIYPYVDFDDKVFLYDSQKGYYEAGSSPIGRDVPEIWHGVIQPNTGNSDTDEEKLVEFFDKTHAFYTKQGIFSNPLQEPYVFYMDLTHDQAAVKPADWKAYNLGLEYMEDIAYNRFNKHLAKTLYDAYQRFQDSADGTDAATLAELGVSIPQIETTDFSSSPDIQTKASILKTTKQFFEIFNEKHIGDILKFVYNTGRYSGSNNVRADIAPVMVSKRDEFMKRVLKDSNTVVENMIDGLVKNGLSRDLAIPVSMSGSTIGSSTTSEGQAPSAVLYQNYYFGKKASEITSARECSIVRGSSLTVEANRGFNIQNIQGDVQLLSQNAVTCFAGGVPQTKDFWGGNSPLNLSTTNLSANDLKNLQDATSPSDYSAYSDKLGTKFTLKNPTYKNYIFPTFDLQGQNELPKDSPLKIASPDDCKQENFIADPYVVTYDDAEGGNRSYFYHPAQTQGTKFTCVMRDSAGALGHKTMAGSGSTLFEQAITNTVTPPACTVLTVTVNPSFSKQFGAGCTEGSGESASYKEYQQSYAFKRIPSWIEHKSPTDEEYGAALKGLTTPSLASDQNRYIDFIAPNGKTLKIEYPNFFRMTWQNEENLTAETVRAKIKEVLDAKSTELNSILSEQAPSKLSWKERALYDALKSGEFPNVTVDLFGILANSGNTLSTLIDTLLWYNERNATSKYAFVLENYLDTDGNRDYPLAGKRSGYELGYIGGPGDTQNMYVKIDPEAKNAPPKEISDVQTDASSLTQLLDGANISSFQENSADFKCGPPEGVPIWQWLPAVFCWLGNILPPTINAGSCGPSLSAKKQQDRNFFAAIDANRDGKPDWQADINQNGIPDGYEWVKDGSIELTTPLRRIGYRTNAFLTATLKKDDRILAHDSFNEVFFDVKRIVLKAGQALPGNTPSNTDRVVYARGGSGDSGKQETLQKYIQFIPAKVRAEAGTSQYGLTSLNLDVDVTLDATVAPKDKNDAIAFTKTSNEITVEVRSESLKVHPVVQLNGSSETSASTSQPAGAAQNITFDFAIQKWDTGATSTEEVKRPLEVRILDDIDGTVLQDTTKITSDTYRYDGSLLKQSGNYRFEFIDGNGRFGTVPVSILAAKPTRIDAIASSSLFVKWQKNTILVRIMDDFGNIAKGNLLTLEAKVSGGWFFVENSDTKLKKVTVEGTTSLEVSSNSGGNTLSIELSLTLSDGKKIEKTIQVRSIDSAKIAMEMPKDFVVGSPEKEVSLKIVDNEGKVLDGFNGIASLDFPKNSGKFTTPFVQIQNGVSTQKIWFIPGTVAGEAIKVDVQVPWIKEVVGGSLNLLPDVPMRVGLSSTNSMLEANRDSKTTIEARLYDRFGNIAYNHAPGMTIDFKIPEGFGKYGSIEGATGFSRGVASATLRATKNPGTLYYIATVSPWLESNSFTVQDKSGASITIKGLSKNVGFIETYYLWNAAKLAKTNYNILSTTLLGADYGNVTVPNYLAGALLFAPESQSLAVTSLLGTGKKQSIVTGVTPGGKVSLSDSSLARIDVGSSREKTTLNIYDPFRRETIGQLYLNTAENTPLYACETSESETLDACDIGWSTSYIVLKGVGSSKVTKSNTLGLTLDGVPVLEIDAKWSIRKYPAITLEVDGKETKNLLAISVKSNGILIGKIGMKWNADRIVQGRGDIDALLASNPGVLVYESISPRYAVQQNYLGNSSFGARGIQVYQISESSNSVDRDMIGSSGKVGLEQFSDKEGIGFGGGNTSHLEFAAGASVGEATKASLTYSQIVLGDPVARLPELGNTQNGYDRTLGKRIDGSLGGTIESYNTLDYNHDGMQDIVVFYADGRVELIQNFSGTYKSLGYLVYVVDAGPERKVAGDFSGDGFWDIVMVDKKGQLIVLENKNGKFTRIPLRIKNTEGSPVSIRGAIMQLEVFDMDKDGKTDLVISDDSGELNILYGNTDSEGMLFTKKLLDSNIGLTLQSDAVSTGWAIRWQGIQEIKAPTQSDYAKESASEDTGTLSAADQIRLLNSKLYYQHPGTRQIASGTQAQEVRIAAAVADDPNNPGSPNIALQQQLQTAISTTQEKAASGSFSTSALTDTTIPETLTYLRSEFADGRNIRVEKRYTDKNGGTLQAGDAVTVSITLSNETGAPLNGVSYLDSNERNVFREGDALQYSVFGSGGSVIKQGELQSITSGDFDYQFDGLSLPSGGKLTIQYEIVASALSYGKFRVGIFETDDVYGDVALNGNAVCGDEEIVWKSTTPAPRSYIRVKRAPQNQGDASGKLDGKFTDFNGNGQPDYIDLLSGEGWSDEIRSSQWNPLSSGILIFREVPNGGVIDGTGFQIARIVAKPGFVQSNPVSQKDDVPVKATAGFTALSASSGKISAGDVSDLSGKACGAPGTVTSDLYLVGVEQTFNRDSATDLTGELKIRARGISKTLDTSGKVTSQEECVLQMNERSKPEWSNGSVSGIGWKILTKSTFNHFSLAGRQADIIRPELGIPDASERKGGELFSYDPKTGLRGSVDLSGMSETQVDTINSQIDTIVQGLGCGFGGGSCLALPLNWAPLAPGSAPVLFGSPIYPLTPDTGYPVFSALTGNQTMCGKTPCCLPSAFPMHSQAYIPGPFCWPNSAGGRLGTWSPTNTFRLFITPTITGSVGVAACYGGPAKVTGNLPPQGVSPLVPGGNCIVAAKPLAGCADDGSDGSISELGSTDNGTINANGCKAKSSSETLSETDRSNIKKYLNGNTSVVSDIVANAAGRGSFRMPSLPLLRIGNNSTGGGDPFEISIDPKNIKNFDTGFIEKIKHDRVSAFPDFIMDWVNRQLEEVANKLTSLPTLYIINPDFQGVIDSGWAGFSDKLGQQYAAGSANGTAVLKSEQAGRTISGVKAAYEFMARLPLLKFERHTLNVTYPDIGEEELNKWLVSAKATQAQWKREIEDKKKAYAALGTKEGVDTSIIVRAEELSNGIGENIRTVEEYKKFPDKLAKYLTWKERYASQLLCNVTAIQNMLDVFIGNNALRFKAWVEFGELIKNILKGWQLIPNLFYKYNAECGVCRNERYDAKHFKFKLLKSVVPSIPIIRFPKWPDIILDLHNVRLGLRIPMPEFVFTATPFVLPQLPRLLLPTVPKLGVGLPWVPVLPQIPPLPNLPDLPTLPTVELPELPPPPTIPKLFGSIKFTLNILKIIAKVLCIMRSNPFVPEWRAGDQIAQITERQGKLKIDFLNIEFPQFNASFIDAIKVTTFVNFEFQVDFLLEMARATFEPFNTFTANLSNVTAEIPGVKGNVDLRGINPGNKEIRVGPTSMAPTGDILALSDEQRSLAKQYIQTLAQAFVTTLRQGQAYADVPVSYEDARANLQDELAHTHATPGTEEFKLLASMSENLRKRGDAEASELAAKLKSENAGKFGIANRFIQDELAETARLKAELAEVQQGRKTLGEAFGKAKQASGSFTLTTANPAETSTESPLPDFQKYNALAFESYTEMLNPKTSDGIQEAASELKERAAVYQAAVEKNSFDIGATTASSAESGNLVQYEYRGIYAMQDGKQIRLFDYTDDLTGNERALAVDRFGNGTIEYIYQSGEWLYIKERIGGSRPSPSTESVSSVSLSDILDASTTPTAPNHFTERFAASGEVNFGFKPANAQKDTLFALEFYDYIDRHIREMRGENIGLIEWGTKVSRVDLVPDITNDTIQDASKPGLILRKPFAVYGAGRWEATMSGPVHRILRTGEKIRVSANRSIYTSTAGARVRYQLADTTGTPTGGIQSIPESGELAFQATMDIEVLSGEVVIIDTSAPTTKRTVDLGSLKWLPVFKQTNIDISLRWARIDLEYYNGAELQMNGPIQYQAYDLWSKSTEYSVSLRQENAWYYAKLWVITKENHTTALITLLSPQIQADTEPPTFTLATTLRAPVYQDYKIDLSEMIRDNSGIKEVFVDTNLDVDTNGDGIKENDRDSETGTGIIRKGSNPLEIFVRPQESLFTKKIRFWATDEVGNTSNKESSLVIYSPLPNIQSQSGSSVAGSLDETLANEPIDLLRFRGWLLKRIWETAKSDTSGGFKITPSQGTGVILQGSDGSKLATIDEQRGLIQLSGSGLQIDMQAASADRPTSVFIRKNGVTIYTQALALGTASKIVQVGSIQEAMDQARGWVWVLLDEAFTLTRNSANSPSLPNGAFITGKNRKPLFGIASDGNIYTLEPSSTLTYGAKNGILAIEVRSSGALIATLFYVIEAEYSIK